MVVLTEMGVRLLISSLQGVWTYGLLRRIVFWTSWAQAL
jgi:hypothetical protein